MDHWLWSAEDFSLDSSKDEVFVTSVDGIGLYDGSKKTDWPEGKVLLSSHRLLFQPKHGVGKRDGKIPFLELDLESVRKSGVLPTMRKGLVFASDKVVLHLPEGKFVQLAFRSGGMSNFFTQLISVLDKELWRNPQQRSNLSKSVVTHQPVVPHVTADRPVKNSHCMSRLPPAKHIGIAGVMQVTSGGATLQETFNDIDDVMAKASSLVHSIKRLKERSAIDSGSRQGGQNEEDMMAIESIESTLGLGTMVQVGDKQRKNHSNQQRHFHKELAGELHAWLVHPKNERLFGGMPLLPLIELFSMYNRARSGDLVSPEDVLMACREINKWESGALYRLETLPSGCVALIHNNPFIAMAKLPKIIGPMLIATHKTNLKAPDDAITEDTKAQLTRKIETTKTFPRSSVELKSINDIQLASLLHISEAVAHDILYKLTMQGYLCLCDHGFGCSIYYWNIFVF
ncbi:unnamed protein product [Phytomonas sp. EM1]|nr:unnamed protein product [Phytomonas sp. EM1]|eukprot:CCW64679.1 unnamed protein product [Phytomonas sp. isolate EM1]